MDCWRRDTEAGDEFEEAPRAPCEKLGGKGMPCLSPDSLMDHMRRTGKECPRVDLVPRNITTVRLAEASRLDIYKTFRGAADDLWEVLTAGMNAADRNMMVRHAAVYLNERDALAHEKGKEPDAPVMQGAPAKDPENDEIA